MVAILQGSTHICSGVIYNNKAVLSLSYCIPNANDLKIRAGSKEANGGGSIFNVQYMYRQGGDIYIALVILFVEGSINPSPEIKYIQLPIDNRPSNRVHMQTVGWDDQSPNRLMFYTGEYTLAQGCGRFNLQTQFCLKTISTSERTSKTDRGASAEYKGIVALLQTPIDTPPQPTQYSLYVRIFPNNDWITQTVNTSTSPIPSSSTTASVTTLTPPAIDMNTLQNGVRSIVTVALLMMATFLAVFFVILCLLILFLRYRRKKTKNPSSAK